MEENVWSMSTAIATSGSSNVSNWLASQTRDQIFSCGISLATRETDQNPLSDHNI
jgi:hypothetical protein